MNRSRILGGLVTALLLGACGGGENCFNYLNDPDDVGSCLERQAAALNKSPGGIWIGTDSEGDDIVALVTETGRFHFLEMTTLAQGSGVLNVTAGNRISAGFNFVPPLGFLLADGSPFSNCNANGTIAERSTLNATVDCTTSLGSRSSVSINLKYDALYDLDSNLRQFSGSWTDSSNPGVDVVNIDATGVISGQDGSGSNCVYSGRVSMIDTRFNAYSIEWTYANCTGQFSALNGVVFTGIGAIDNSTNPVMFMLAATGIAQGNEVSLILVYQKV